MRNKKILFILALVLTGLLFIGFVGIANSITKKSEHFKVVTNLKNVSEHDIDRVLNEAEIAIEKISPILGLKKRKSKIVIKIVDFGICRTTPEREILLPVWNVKDKTAAIVHEVTHIIARHSDNKFFSEGLAIYFQERFGEDHGFPNFEGFPLDDLVRAYEDRLIPIYKLANNNDIFRKIDTEKRKIALLEAGSFFNFLVETYGEQKLEKLQNSLRLIYNKVYGKNLKKLEIEWKKFVFEDKK
jgi:hypothetical protein